MVLEPSVNGMRPHESRWLGGPNDLAIAENIVFEHDLTQKDPAALIYDPQGADLIELAAVLSASSLREGVAVLVSSLATAIDGGQIGSANNAAPPSSWVISSTLGAAIGDIIVVALGRRGVTTSPIATNVTDSRGNLYTRLSATASTDPTSELWAAPVTTSFNAGDTWTVSINGTAANLVFCASKFTDVTTTLIDQVTLPPATSASAFFDLPRRKIYPSSILGVMVWESATATIAWGAPTTESSSAALGGGSPLKISLTFGNYPRSRAIQAQIDFQSTQIVGPGGSVTIALNSPLVVGSGTTFTSLNVGDLIMVSGEQHRIDFIQSNTVLHCEDAWQQSASAVPFSRRDGPRLLTAYRGQVVGERPGIDITNPQPNMGDLNFYGLATTSDGAFHSRFILGAKETSGLDRKWFFVNGVDPPKAGKNGSTAVAASIAKPAFDWGTVVPSWPPDPGKMPINGIVHPTGNSDRLVLFGNLNDGHRLYFSNADDHEDFQTANLAFQMRIASHIGERLYGAAEYQGVLFLWKYPVGIFYLDDTPTDPLSWSYRVKSDGLGCAPSPYAVLSINDDVLFMGPDGHIHRLSAVDSLGGVLSSDLTRALGLHVWTQQNINTRGLDSLTSVWNPYNKTAYFGCRSLHNAVGDNDLLLKLDFGLVDRGGSVRFSYSTAWAPNSLCLKRRDIVGTPALMIGEASTCYFVDPTQFGFRTTTGVGTDNIVTVGFSSRMRTPALDFDEASPAHRWTRKSFLALELVFAELLSQPVSVAIEIDGQDRGSITLAPTGSRRVQQVLKVGDGYEIAIDVQTDGAVAEDLALLGAIVWYRATADDHSRRA